MTDINDHVMEEITIQTKEHEWKELVCCVHCYAMVSKYWFKLHLMDMHKINVID